MSKFIKGKRHIKTNFNYTEEFKTNKENITEEGLKTIFNKKYFNYIKKVENRILWSSSN